MNIDAQIKTSHVVWNCAQSIFPIPKKKCILDPATKQCLLKSAIQTSDCVVLII